MSYSLALGPTYIGWRGPQRIVLTIDGEHVVDLDYRDGFNERGCAERLTRLDLPQALHLVTRICGTCSFAHSLAFCQALEQLCGLAVADRAAYLRSTVAELERLASHLWGATGLLDALGMEPQAHTLSGLREVALQMLQAASGARIIPDLCVPGGLRHDLAAANREIIQLGLPRMNRALYRVIDRLIDNRTLLARTVEVGVLPRPAAEQFGVRGPLARASGIARDARLDQPYAAYSHLNCRMVTQEGGDVYARLVVLVLEALESAKLAEQALRTLPDGDWRGEVPPEISPGQSSATVEGPHGLLRYSIESDGRRLTQVRIETPRQLDRLLARTLLVGALPDNIVPIVASCDVCTACAEL